MSTLGVDKQSSEWETRALHTLSSAAQCAGAVTVWLECCVSHSLKGAGRMLRTSWTSCTLRRGINGLREVSQHLSIPQGPGSLGTNSVDQIQNQRVMKNK